MAYYRARTGRASRLLICRQLSQNEPSQRAVGKTMGKTTQARNAIGPLLEQLILQLDGEGSMTQRAHFDRIRRSLYLARSDTDLTTPILALSTSTAVGFKFSSNADALVHRILEKASLLAEELGSRAGKIH